MMRRKLFVELISFLIASCSKSVTNPNGSGNLISNPNFEQNGKPSLKGWIVIGDSSWTKVVQDSLPGNLYNYSLQLAPGRGPFAGGGAKTYITGLSGQSSYTLSFWGKNSIVFAWGQVYLTQIRAGQELFRDLVSADTTSWTLFSKTETLNTLPSDTIEVFLSNESLAVRAHPENIVDSVGSGIFFTGVSLTKNN